MDPQLRQDLTEAVELVGGDALLELEPFQEVMEHVLTESKRGPRTYMKPPSSRTHVSAEEECTHHPRVNRTSSALAARRRRADDTDLYAALMSEQEATARRLKELKHLQEVRSAITLCCSYHGTVSLSGYAPVLLRIGAWDCREMGAHALASRALFCVRVSEDGSYDGAQSDHSDS
jgi:hypothetical protein